MNAADRVLPLKTAYTGVSCANCMETSDNLLKCARCKQAHFCNRQCQMADWKKHKHECQLLCVFKACYDRIARGATLGQKAAFLHELIPAMKVEGLLAEAVGKDWKRNRGFIEYARSCSVCGKNEFELESADWVHCPRCQFGWCCSQEHFDEHQRSSDGHTQETCDKFVQSIAVSRFHWKHCKEYDDEFVHPPTICRTEPMENFPENWDEYFQIRCPDAFLASQQDHLPREFLPAATKQLSQPATCLYAMYMHGIDEFKNKNTLTIHIVGASMAYEVPPTCIWEEILHCLPNVQKLRMIFVGPDAWNDTDTETQEFDIGCCPTCTYQNRERTTAFFGLTYHDYHAHANFSTPDLVVAFNTGMFEEYTDSWKTSVGVILDLNAPALFTSYTKDEAIQDHAVLTSLNANVLADEPILNPVRDDHQIIEAHGHFDSFFQRNMYCMGFKGRV